jgi:bifunctional UDP-N-acetylglucosamine pyrophosphorylase/glucosamine-1-phosphate N-acetyltransferase
MLIDAVVMAAGKGTRMKSDLAKVLHPVAGRPLIAHVLATARAAGIGRIVAVVGHQRDRVMVAVAAPDLEFAVQEPQLGTGHAVMQAAPLLREGGFTVVLSGDVPLLTEATLRRLVDEAAKDGVAAAVLTCIVDDAGAYGRVVKDDAGRLLRIVEARDAGPAEKAIREFNTGVYCYRTELLQEALRNLTTDNDQQEYYLTDTIGYLVARGHDVRAVATRDVDEVMGINTVDELARAETLHHERQAS